MNVDTPQIAIRPGGPGDRRFVVSSWMQSYVKGGRAPEVQWPIYKTGHSRLVEALWNSGAVLVATPQGMDDEICGWLAGSFGLIHYVYVKQVYRKLGVAKQLIATAGGMRQHTHETIVGQKLAAKYQSRYNPYLLNPLTAGLNYGT